MFAMVLDKPGTKLRATEIELPPLGPEQIQIRVHACGVCRTDLHVVDGELPDPKLPLVPGHEIVGTVVDARRAASTRFALGERVGVPWLGWTCGACRLLPRRAREPLRPAARSPATRSTAAMPSYAVADERYCFAIPDGLRRRRGRAAAVRRADRLSRAACWPATARRLGIYGFGAAAHIVAQVARHQGRECLRVHPPRRRARRSSSRASSAPPGPATRASRRPSRSTRRSSSRRSARWCPRRCARVAQGRHRGLRRHPHERHPSFPYRLLWGERVRALGRQSDARDGEEFLDLAPRSRCACERRTIRCGRPTRRSTTCRGGRVTARPCCCPTRLAKNRAGNWIARRVRNAVDMRNCRGIVFGCH